MRDEKSPPLPSPGTRSNTAGSDDWDSLGRSDSLSLDVEYVRLNIFRYRRAALLCPHVTPPESSKRQRRTGVTEPPRVTQDSTNLKLVNTVQISGTFLRKSILLGLRTEERCLLNCIPVNNFSGNIFIKHCFSSFLR